jgi:PAS domain S-box-containing protein
MPQIVWTAGPEGVIDYYNERWYEFTGYSHQDTVSWEQILAPDDIERTREAYYRALDSGQAYNVEYRLWDRNNKGWRWFVGRAVPVRDAEGKIVKWFGTCTDIDDQKRVQEELRRANEDLEQFAFSASHDLQEPLRTISIYSELLGRYCGDQLDSNALQYMRFVREGATRMEALVHDLLAYTRTAEFETPTESTDAHEALNAVLSDLGPAISEAGARVSADPLPSVRVHPTHLQQLLQNLIANAVKFRNPGTAPEVHISAERKGDQWIFTVQDNGIGIEPQYRENIFGLFKRLHTNAEYAGTGLGLAICQRIVDRYHGRIWVESQPGRGSAFHFTLPV